MSNVTPRVVEYVLEGGTDDLGRFNELVNAQVKKGFQPVGPAICIPSEAAHTTGIEFYQTMVKYYSVGGDG